jgi:hypothetical protein
MEKEIASQKGSVEQNWQASTRKTGGAFFNAQAHQEKDLEIVNIRDLASESHSQNENKIDDGRQDNQNIHDYANNAQDSASLGVFASGWVHEAFIHFFEVLVSENPSQNGKDGTTEKPDDAKDENHHAAVWLRDPLGRTLRI